MTDSLNYAGAALGKKYKRSEVDLAGRELRHIHDLAHKAMDLNEDGFEYGGNVYTFSDRAGSVSDVDVKKKSAKGGV